MYKVNNEDQATKRTILKTKHKLKQMHKKTQTRTILKTKLSVETSAQKTTIHPNLIWKNVMCRLNFKLDWTK